MVPVRTHVFKSWAEVCRNTPDNARRAWTLLTTDPTRSIPRRLYDLKGVRYRGCRGYEMGSGDRLYFKLNIPDKKVLVYYVGKHPNSVPTAPPDC
jgi:hypothetical protein